MPHNLSEVFIQTLEQAADAVVVVNGENRVILFNRAAERLWGVARETLLGASAERLLPQPWRGESQAPSRDVPVRGADGEVRWCSMSVATIEVGGQHLYTAFIKDVTAQHDEREKLQLLSLVVDHTDNAIVITDAQWRIVYVNQGFSRMFGYRDEEAIGRMPAEVIAPYLDCAAIEHLREHLAAGVAYHAEEMAHTRDGQRIWCKIATNPVFDLAGQMSRTVTVLTDITHTKMHEVLQNRVLQAMVREEPLERLMELACREIERLAPEAIAAVLRIDGQGRLRPLASPSLPASYAQSLDGLPIGQRMGSCGCAAEQGRAVLSEDIEHDPCWDNARHLVLPLGLRACWSVPIKSSDGRVLGTFCLYFREPRRPSQLHEQLLDVIVDLCALALEREESRSHIHQLVSYDGLTGLPNRSLLRVKAEQALHELARQGEPLAVLFVDVDRFKLVNDSLGMDAGDALLCLLAERLEHNRQHSDIVSRLSVDEFVLVLPRCGNAQIAEVLEQLRALLMAPANIAGETFSPSVSIGISLYPDDGQDIDTLLQHADMAMGQAKTEGRGGFSFFRHEMNYLAHERLALESALRGALANDGLHLHYQPQIRLADARLHGLEALARWWHPQFGDISPSRFIPLVEDCGLVGKLGDWVINEACRQLAEWRGRGLQVPTVSVNLSPTNFHDPGLPGRIEQILERHGLAARDLTVEVTEGVLLDARADTLATLGAVQELGVSLSLDDFGTGYSSLSYLRRLPIRELKLDRSFVQDLEIDATNQALAEVVIRLGESLGLTVVAEGVETEAQYRLLKDKGYHVVQGYLLSRPLSAEALERWLLATAGKSG